MASRPPAAGHHAGGVKASATVGHLHERMTNVADRQHDAVLSWEEFQGILERALKSGGAKTIVYSQDKSRVLYSMVEGETDKGKFSEVFAANLYEKKKFFTADECFKGLRSITEGFPNSPDVKRMIDAYSAPKVLYPTVQTHGNILDANEGFRDPVSGHFVDHNICRAFSAGSGELYLALVLGLERDGELMDVWLPSACLKNWSLTEDQAFAKAVSNLDKITPKKIGFKTLGNALEIRKFVDSCKDKYPVLHDIVGVQSPSSGGSLIIQFRDQRALPRLLLPRLVEKLAEVLQCNATSLAVVPFDDGFFYAGSGEDPHSMLKLSRHQFLPESQVDTLHWKHKVTHSPFRVKTLCNAKGLVELEQYLVHGGRFAVQVLDGSKIKTFYPYARTQEDIRHLGKASTSSSKRPLKVLTEGAFLDGLCYQCREKNERLQKCANCRKAKYCSRECQKKAWASGHNVNCEERRLYWERAKLRRENKKGETAEK